MKKRDEHKPLGMAAGSLRKRSLLENFHPLPRLACVTQTKTSGCWTVTTVFTMDVRVTDIEVRALKTGLPDATMSTLFQKRLPRNLRSPNAKGRTNAKG